VQFEQKQTLAGESWDFGKIVLSWQDTLKGTNIPDDGRNVVIHDIFINLTKKMAEPMARLC